MNVTGGSGSRAEFRQLPFVTRSEGSAAARRSALGRVGVCSRELVAAAGFSAAVRPVADTTSCRIYASVLPRLPARERERERNVCANIVECRNVLRSETKMCQGLHLTNLHRTNRLARVSN
jgi:hypothetical protein